MALPVRGLNGINFSSGTEELLAVWSRSVMIRRSSSWVKAPITLTNDQETHFENFLNGAFMVNGIDSNYFYDGSTWYSNSTNTNDSPIANYIKKYNTRLYLFNIKILGTAYPSRLWFSDLPKNGQIKWGLETGTNLVQTANSAVVSSSGSTFQTNNIKVGDPFTITTGANAGEYAVQSIDSETQITLTESLDNTATSSSFWVGGNWIDIQTDDGDSGQGMGLTSNALFCFKKGSLFTYNERGQELRQVRNAPGTTSPRSIVSEDGQVYWYHPSGIYRTDGTQEELISNAIEDAIEGVTLANQDNVVGWANTMKNTINFYLGNITLRDGETITNCVASFDTNLNIWGFRSYDRVIKCATNWLESNLPSVYAGDSLSGVIKLDTGTSFDSNPITFDIVLKPIFPISPDHLVDFSRVRLYIDNGLGISVYYKLLYKPMQYREHHWVNDKDWKPMKGSQLAERTEWFFPMGTRASGVQLKITESGGNESFLVEYLSLYSANASDR